MKVLRTDYMREVVDDWRKQIRASTASPERSGFMKTARMCDEFFRGSMGSMWQDQFRKENLGNMPAPRFKVTVAKAFELVSIVGPGVMWSYPGRVSKPVRGVELPREVFPEGEEGDAEYEEFLVEKSRALGQDTARAELMDRYLNYSQREQPGPDGLVGASRLAIVDAIVKGRGCLVVEPYKFPGSDRTLTGAFYMNVEDLYLDPGCRHADLSDCGWMARRRVSKYWKLEEKFNLPKDSLKDKCTAISPERSASVDSAQALSERSQGVGNHDDTIVWYEIWSTVGVGGRSMKHPPEIATAMDKVVGDHAYLAIADNVDYPLNYPPKVANKANDEEVEEAFAWPVPYYLDGRWPIAMLDFHDIPGSPWPQATLAMGLGELVFMNVIMSCLMERAHESCQSILAVDESLEDEIVARIKSKDFSGVVGVNLQGKANSINDYIAFLKTPDLKTDVFAVLDIVATAFDKRTGLSDLLYGMNPGGKVSRSAADANTKEQAINVRPEEMQRRAENWQTTVANLERIAAGWRVSGQDLTPLLTPLEAKLWDLLIYSADPETYVRQMRVTLEANSIKKPNKFRDNQNIQQVIGYLLPILSSHWQSTGDPTALNNFIKSLAKAMDQDPESWLLPELQPPQEPPPDPMQQEKQRIDLESASEGLRGKRLRNEKLEQESMPVVSPEELGMDMPMAMSV